MGFLGSLRMEPRVVTPWTVRAFNEFAAEKLLTLLPGAPVWRYALLLEDLRAGRSGRSSESACRGCGRTGGFCVERFHKIQDHVSDALLWVVLPGPNLTRARVPLFVVLIFIQALKKFSASQSFKRRISCDTHKPSHLPPRTYPSRAIGCNASQRNKSLGSPPKRPAECIPFALVSGHLQVAEFCRPSSSASSKSGRNV